MTFVRNFAEIVSNKKYTGIEKVNEIEILLQDIGISDSEIVHKLS